MLHDVVCHEVSCNEVLLFWGGSCCQKCDVHILLTPAKLYGGVEGVDERHRHRFEVNVDVVDALEAAGMEFVGQDSERRRMEIMEVKGV